MNERSFMNGQTTPMREPGGKRDLIKSEAMRLFVAHGTDAVSVRDIAAACDMKPSNLYAHFASKEALAAELFHENYAEYGAILHEAASGTAPFRVRLDRLVRTICRLHDEDNTRFRFLIMTQHGFLADVPHDERNPVEVICRAVAAAMQTGEIPSREPNLMAMALIGIIVQPATARLYGRLHGSLTERAGELVALCWRALS
jgi:AcrR family transcriptional regulator